MSPPRATTGCCIVGGGPGGMFLALLLARQGVAVTLLEAHHDFDRDFRGDTIHPSTLELLDRMGLARALHELPHTKLVDVSLTTGGVRYLIASFRRLPSKFPYIMLMSQARLLDFLADHGRSYPNLTILLGAQATDLIRDGDQVKGVVYHADGQRHELEALVTVGADGRFSKLRKLAGLEPIRTSPPMDVVWLRLPRHDSDSHDFGFMVGNGRLCVLLERETQWQIGFVIPKGGYQQLRAAGIASLQKELAAIVPWLADRVHLLDDWQAVTLLSVESSRLARWYIPGLLLIGDAAHAMSPVGGVGISYAVQDAVAASNLLTDPLRAGRVEVRHLAAVQARREWPTRIIQLVQSFPQRQLVAKVLDRGKPFRVPLALQLVTQVPLLNQLLPRLIGFGVRRETPRFRPTV
jgi:2-polyprenyl-6-methoxyphenol hydroxylase-like FAD-dependent oxidoreductase